VSRPTNLTAPKFLKKKLLKFINLRIISNNKTIMNGEEETKVCIRTHILPRFPKLILGEKNLKKKWMV
jgi:hypothetical protein